MVAISSFSPGLCQGIGERPPRLTLDLTYRREVSKSQRGLNARLVFEVLKIQSWDSYVL